MIKKDETCRLETKLKFKPKSLSKSVEMEIAGASALMEAEMVLDSNSSDYILGFLQGFEHCLKLGERFDVINSEKDMGLF